jgi:DNA (cytosine-5)-methyltransferase 1
LRDAKVASLFAGIGGFDVGFHLEGMRTSLVVDNAPAAQAVLRDRFPGATLVDDVREVDDVGDVQILTAGFPCQDLSSVGQKRGIEGTRSRLVGEVFRVLEHRRVPWVVLENVPFIRQLARGAALDLITSSLEELDYRWAYRVVDAHAFGIPQRRRRWVLVASTVGDPRAVLLAGDAPPALSVDQRGTACGFYWTEGMRALGWTVDGVPPIKGGSTVGVASPPGIRLSDGSLVTPDIRDAERLQGFEPDWTGPAEDVVKPGFRWQLVGNAVSVAMSRWLAERLVAPGSYEPAGDLPFDGDRWPAAAWSDGGGRIFTSSAGSWPRAAASEPLEAFLRFEPKPLSARAATGFLRRTAKGSLRFPEGFLDQVREHALRQGADPAIVELAA